jgi:hypothetical protein
MKLPELPKPEQLYDQPRYHALASEGMVKDASDDWPEPCLFGITITSEYVTGAAVVAVLPVFPATVVCVAVLRFNFLELFATFAMTIIAIMRSTQNRFFLYQGEFQRSLQRTSHDGWVTPNSEPLENSSWQVQY